MKKSNFNVDGCVKVKRGHYEGEIGKITVINEITGWINVIYASWGDPAKQNVVMGPYIESELESISCKTFTRVRNGAVRDFEENMGSPTNEPNKLSKTSVTKSMTRKKRTHTRTVQSPPKDGNFSREEVRKSVRAARKKNREKQTLEEFMTQ